MKRGLVAAACVLVIAVSVAALRSTSPRLEFAALEEPAGFRKLAGRELAVTPSGGAFAGLDDRSEMPPANLDHLHAGTGEGVAVAVFGDYACTVCGPLDERLQARADRGEIALTRHSLARLSDASRIGALAANAAAMQDRPGTLDRRLYRTRFLPTEGWLREVAREEGLDPDRLIADMGSKAAQDALVQSEALARGFGVVATPVLVVGRTVVTGAPSDRVLSALIDAEREEE